jgi:cytosine/adenosine deaminase-related metal-dependent hydrolase
LWRDVALLAARQHRLVAMHLVESPAERQWIDDGTGPFAELHSRLGVPDVPRSPTLIIDACRALAQAPHALIIHGNYLTEPEMDAIAMVRKNLSVVFCPRTHRHFEHSDYPLEALLARGIRVVLGTDSRSSNPDLNLWQEAHTALAQHRSLRPSQALSAITDQAAESIGREAHFGTLRPGRVAALNAIPLEPVLRRRKPVDVEEVFAGWFQNVAHPIGLC